jgi:hypothetical protein
MGNDEVPEVCVLRLHNGRIDSLGSIPMALSNKVALHKSGVLAVFNEVGMTRQIALWKIHENQNHERIHPVSLKQCAVRDSLIWLDFVGETLLGISAKGTAIGWTIKNEYVGRVKLVRRTDDGPFLRAILWPQRGSIFFVTGGRLHKSIHEWKIGCSYLDSWQQLEAG